MKQYHVLPDQTGTTETFYIVIATVNLSSLVLISLISYWAELILASYANGILNVVLNMNYRSPNASSESDGNGQISTPWSQNPGTDFDDTWYI